MVDFNINEWITFWNQEKYQLEQEIISLSMIKDKLWSQKEFYKQKSMLLKERMDRDLAAARLTAQGIAPETPLELPKKDVEIEQVRTRITGTKKFLGLLVDKISELSTSLDTEMAPYLINRENELEEKLQAAQERLATLETQKEAVEAELRSHKKATLSQQESHLSRDSKLEMQLLESREELSRMLDKEDRYILEIKRLKSVNETLKNDHADQKMADTQIANLKYLLDQGSQDYERVQVRLEKMLHENAKIKQLNKDIELERMNLRTKVVGLEKVLKNRDLHHAEDTAKLLSEKRESEKSALALEEEAERLSALLVTVQEELADTRGRLDASIYELKSLQKELAAAPSPDRLLALEEENELLLAELEEHKETITLLEQNVEAMESRVEISEQAHKVAPRTEILEQVSQIQGIINDAFTEEQLDVAIPISADAKWETEEDQQSKVQIEALTHDLRAAESQRSRLELQLAMYEDDKKSLEDKLASLETKYKELAENTPKIESVDPEREERLKEAVSELQLEIDRLEENAMKDSQALMEEKSRSIALEQQIHTLTAQNEELRTKSPAGAASSPEALKVLAALEDHVDDLEDSLVLEGDRLEGGQKDFTALEDSVMTMLDSFEKRLQEKEYEILHISKELQEARSGVQSGEGAGTDDGTLEDLRHSVAAQEQVIEDLSSQLGSLETELLIAQAKNPGAEVIRTEISSIANNLDMMGLSQAASDLRTLAGKIQ